MAVVIVVTNIICFLAILLVGISLTTDWECTRVSKVYIIYQATSMLFANWMQEHIDPTKLVSPWLPIWKMLIVISYLTSMVSVPFGLLLIYSDTFQAVNYCTTTYEGWAQKLGAAVQSSFTNVMAVISLSHLIEVIRVVCCVGPRTSDPLNSYNLTQLRKAIFAKFGIKVGKLPVSQGLRRVLGGRSLCELRLSECPITLEACCSIRTWEKATPRQKFDFKKALVYSKAAYQEAKSYVQQELKQYFESLAPLRYTLRHDKVLVRSREYQVLLIEGIGQFWDYKSSQDVGQPPECCCRCKGPHPNIRIPSCKHKYHFGCLASALICPEAVQYCAVDECADLREDYMTILCAPSSTTSP